MNNNILHRRQFISPNVAGVNEMSNSQFNNQLNILNKKKKPTTFML